MQTRKQQEHAASRKRICELDDDTPEKNANSYDEDVKTRKDVPIPGLNMGNKVSALRTKKKRNNSARASCEDRKQLSKKQKVTKVAGPRMDHESPPIFAFKTINTSFRKRKLLKQERQLEEEEQNKKRIEDLVVYFKNLDKVMLETA
ncbi:unnamed protein product [Peronospora belbahrii]|uniref:Uncharacterized protein n=1 Tax=Peronospora belbahrii TaxID=622444 RepID=A0AAU9L8F3_9STRA|nr:unnamed protein product [Peronospora belbahrii]CAH0517029.1 unnamed protein product [Peronospora belbahrii]